MGMDNKQDLATRKPFNCADQASVTWLQRADLCADLIESLTTEGEINLSLADIGCGDQKLRDALARRALSLHYTGYDIRPQKIDVRRLDICREPLPNGHDLAVLLGVIEYLPDLQEVLTKLAARARILILSHVLRQPGLYSEAALAELGWINHLSASELEDLLSRCGYFVRSRRLTPDGRTLLVICVSHAESRSA